MLDKHKVIESERLCKAKGVQFINIELASQFQCTVDDIRQLSSSATNKHLYNPTQHQGQHPCEFCILEFDSTWALSVLIWNLVVTRLLVIINSLSTARFPDQTCFSSPRSGEPVELNHY